MVENGLEGFLPENDKRSITLINPYYSYCETMSRLSPHVASIMLDFSSLFSSQFVLCIVFFCQLGNLLIWMPLDVKTSRWSRWFMLLLKIIRLHHPGIPIEMSIAWCWLFASPSKVKRRLRGKVPAHRGLDVSTAKDDRKSRGVVCETHIT